MSMRKRKKVQILSREELRLRRWDFGLVPSERRIEAIGGFAGSIFISRDNHIDLFPRTSAVEKMAILKSKIPLIYFRERTARSGGFLTSIWSNRAMLRQSACSPGKPAKSKGFGDLRSICFCAFCLVGLKICFRGAGGVRKTELLAKG